MVTEIKSKCYTCLNPIALASHAGCQGTDLNIPSSTLDHPRVAHRLVRSSIISTQTIKAKHTRSKQES